MRRFPTFSRAPRLSDLALWALAAALGVLACSGAAQAQGTMGTVPDPISARELEGYAARLRLSDQQRQAVDSFHDQYKQEFSQLRDSDIEKYLQENAANAQNGPGGPGGRGGPGGGGMRNMMGLTLDRKATEKNLKSLDNIIDRIKGIDDRFFDQILTVLAEDQVPLLQGVRQARERVRCRTGLVRMTSFMNPATQVDLSELMTDLALTPAEHETVDPVIAGYESNLTAAIRRLHERGSTMVLDIIDKLASQGITEETVRDPERRAQMFQSFRTVWTEANGKQQEIAVDISDLNLRTQRSLLPLLTPEHARAFRDEFVDRAYRDANLGGKRHGRSFGIALGFQELTDEQRQNIAAMADSYHASVDHLVDQAIELIDKNRKTATFFDFDRESRRKFEEAMDELRDKRRSLGESTRLALNAALGPELSERLEKRMAAGDGEGGDALAFTVSGDMIAGGAVVTSIKLADGELQVEAAKDPFIPEAITRRELDSYAAMLRISDEDLPILASMHGDYLDKYKVIEDTDVKAAHEAESGMWSFGRGGRGGGDRGDVKPPTEQSVGELYAARSRALQAVLALDASFFGDIHAALLSKEQEPSLDRVVAARLRKVYNRGGGNAMFNMPGGRRGNGNQGGRGPGGGGPGGRAFRMFTGGGSEETGIDLLDIINDAKPSAEEAGKIGPIISAYEAAVTQAFQHKYETAVQLQQARDKMIAKAAAQGDGGGQGGGQRGGFGAMGDGFRALMENEGKLSREADAAVASLNRDTLSKMVEALPDAAGQSIKRAYNRRAFPDVYHDPRAADGRLASAMQLADLTEPQRSQIQEIAAEYQGAYEELCEQLAALESKSLDVGAMLAGGPGGAGQVNWQAMQDQARAREKLEFERNDLSDKATTRLKAVLNEEQVRRLGGLSIRPEDD